MSRYNRRRRRDLAVKDRGEVKMRRGQGDKGPDLKERKEEVLRGEKKFGRS